MKNTREFKRVFALALAATMALGLAACGSSSSSTAESSETAETTAAESTEAVATEAAEADAAEEPAEVVTYKIATEGAYAPYNYLDEDGNPDGYDIAVAKAVDELLPGVEFEYQAVEWSSIFAGLEAERYDMIVSQAVKNEEREAKYLFGDVPYTYTIGAIAYQAGRTDIKSMNDLAGKTCSVALGSSNANILETWNAEHGNVVEVVYGDGDVTKALLDVQEGRVDSTLVDPITADLVINEQGLNVETVLRGDSVIKPTYWLYANTEKNQELKPLVDEALQTLIDNGTLSELSKQYLGEDYSSEEAVQARIGQ